MKLITQAIMRDYFEDGLLQIDNYEKKNQKNSYYLFRLGSSIGIWNNATKSIDKCDINIKTENQISIPPNGYILIRTLEKFKLSTEVMGIFGQISDIALEGFRLNNSLNIDPGFEGYLEMGFENILNTEKRVTIGKKIGKITFYDISDSPISVKPHNQNEKLINREKVEVDSSYLYWKKRIETGK